MMRLARFGLGVLTVYATVAGIMWALQDTLVFPAGVPRPVQPGPGGELLRYPLPGAAAGAPEGAILYHPPPTPDAPLVVHFHGNGTQIGDLGWNATLYGDLGVGFAAIEYPGYGLLGGLPVGESEIFEVVEAGLEALSAHTGRGRDQLVVQGRSLGTGVAVEMARRGWGDRLVLISPYTSVADVAAASYPWLPVRLLLRHSFDSLGRVPELTQPTLVLHGVTDVVIPVRFGRSLVAALRARGGPATEYVELPRAGHNDIFGPDRAQAVAGVRAFLLP